MHVTDQTRKDPARFPPHSPFPAPPHRSNPGHLERPVQPLLELLLPLRRLLPPLCRALAPLLRLLLRPLGGLAPQARHFPRQLRRRARLASLVALSRSLAALQLVHEALSLGILRPALGTLRLSHPGTRSGNRGEPSWAGRGICPRTPRDLANKLT